jgi:hypothetical protein
MSRNHRQPLHRPVHPIIRQIIDRDCHVSMRNRDVIRHVISKLRAMARDDRRELLRQCIACHRENWELYVDVMSGDPSGRRRRKRRRNGGSTPS